MIGNTNKMTIKQNVSENPSIEPNHYDWEYHSRHEEFN